MRNDPQLIWKGVLKRKWNACKAGNHQKWLKLDELSWKLFGRLVWRS